MEIIMNETNLKNTMDQINIPEDMQKKLIKNLCRQTIEENYQYKYKKKYRAKMLLSAAAILLVIGAVSIPAQAGIRRSLFLSLSCQPKWFDIWKFYWSLELI